MMPQAPISEIGTDRLAITVARMLCKKAKITSTTSSTDNSSSISTCSTEARMPVVRSLSTSSFMAAGRLACRSGSSALMASTVLMTLAPGWRCTFRMMAGCLPDQAPRRVFSALSTTFATSDRRTGAPFL
ncbi:hypothetical protein D3C72_1181390 [compost metagenome]